MVNRKKSFDRKDVISTLNSQESKAHKDYKTLLYRKRYN